MTTPLPHDAPRVPVPLEQYAQTFDDLFHTRIQRQRFREYLVGLLLPRDRNKTLTALVGAEPITQAQTAPVQQLQFFLSEAEWNAEAVTSRQIELLLITALAEHWRRRDGRYLIALMPGALGFLLADGVILATGLGYCPASPSSPQGMWPVKACTAPLTATARHHLWHRLANALGLRTSAPEVAAYGTGLLPSPPMRPLQHHLRQSERD